MIIGADFDGTWTDHPEIWGQTQVIITGNSWERFEIVINDWVGPRKPIMFAPYGEKDVDLIKIVNHKANMINTIGVGKYYENNPEAVDMLKILCPDTEIILVKGGNTFI